MLGPCGAKTKTQKTNPKTQKHVTGLPTIVTQKEKAHPFG